MRQSRTRLASARVLGATGARKQLVGTCPQADFDVRQAFSIGELREGHGEELIPTRKATNLVVASVAVDTAAKLFGMNPVGQLRKNQFSSGHNASLAS